MCHLTTGGRPRATRETPIKFRAAPANRPEHRINRSRSNERRTNSSENADRNLVFEALEEARWNKSEAARLLRCSRMTIHRKVVYYDLRRPDIASPEQNYGE
jgi:DNA-binding NtrC family response regulator